MPTIDGLHDQMISFDEDHHGGKQDTLVIGRSQYIPDDYIADLLRAKIDATHDRIGELMRVATVPVVFVEKWKREGFDIYKESAAAIVSRLKREGLDAFCTGHSV
jgi:hypothetical protein